MCCYIEAYKSGQLSYECESCYWDTASETASTNALENKSTNVQSPSIIEIEDDGNTYHCDQCDFKTKDAADLVGHVGINHEVRCEICEQAFMRVKDLSEHKKDKHTGNEQGSSSQAELPESDDANNVEKHLAEKCKF